MRAGSAGLTLIEVLVALLLIALGLLAVAPMFVQATSGNASSADFGTVGALAVERMELLRVEDFDALTTGGSLDSDVTGYVDTSNSGFVVRWMIEDYSGVLDGTKRVRVRAIAQRTLPGPQREVTLVSLRGE